MKKKNIAVIFGGNNSEHEVSLSSVTSVIDVANKEKYNIIYVAVLKNGNWIIGDDALEYLEKRDDKKLIERNDISQFVDMAVNGKIDLVLPILHGAFGEDGRLQGFLDVLGVPHVFSSHTAHAIGMDKVIAKRVVEGGGVQVIPDVVLRKNEEYDLNNIAEKLGESVFVKPTKAGSSVGISKVDSIDELEGAIEKAFEYGDEVLIEKTVVGRELTVAIIEHDGEQKVLPIIEIISHVADWFDYESKYSDGGCEHICPAKISTEIAEVAEKYAKDTFNALGCKDLSRFDFLWDEKSNELYFLEINTIPGMTGTSLVPDAARVAGISFDVLINRLIGNNL